MCVSYHSLIVGLFRFYDLRQDNLISRDELKRITEAMLFQYGIKFSDELLNSIVEETFGILGMWVTMWIVTYSGKEDSISYEQFCKIPNIDDPIIEMSTIV